MARAIRIPFTADPREFIRGLGLMEDDVQKFERRLRDSEDAGDQLEDNLEANFRGIANDAEQAGRKAGSSFDQQLTTNVRKGSFRGAAGALLAETADEFIESWGEAIREGNPAGVIREVFSNAALIGAAAFGPVGAGVGLALSLVTSFIDTNAKEKENVRNSVAALFDNVVGDQELTGQEAAAAFWRGYVDEAQIPAQVQEALGLETLREAAVEVGRIVGETSLEYETVQKAIIGNSDALGEVRAKQAEVRDEASQAYDLANDMITVDSARADELLRQYRVLDDQDGALGDILAVGERIAEGNQESARALLQGRDYADDTRDIFRRTTPPNLDGMNRDLDDAARTADTVQQRVRGVPDPPMSNLTRGLGTAEDQANRIKATVASIQNRAIYVDVNYRTRGAPKP